MRITLVSDKGGEWEGIYVNGKLIREGDMLTSDDILHALRIEYDYREVEMKDGDRLPPVLGDIKN